MANTSLPNLTERTATANSDLIHVNSGGTDYKETKANFLSDVNASINSLNNSLANKSSIKYINGTENVTFTIPASGYYQLQRPDAVQGKNVFAIAVVSWGSNTGAFWIMPYGTSTYDYVVGTSGVQVKNLRVRYWYMDE